MAQAMANHIKVKNLINQANSKISGTGLLTSKISGSNGADFQVLLEQIFSKNLNLEKSEKQDFSKDALKTIKDTTDSLETLEEQDTDLDIEKSQDQQSLENTHNQKISEDNINNSSLEKNKEDLKEEPKIESEQVYATENAKVSDSSVLSEDEIEIQKSMIDLQALKSNPQTPLIESCIEVDTEDPISQENLFKKLANKVTQDTSNQAVQAIETPQVTQLANNPQMPKQNTLVKEVSEQASLESQSIQANTQAQIIQTSETAEQAGIQKQNLQPINLKEQDITSEVFNNQDNLDPNLFSKFKPQTENNLVPIQKTTQENTNTPTDMNMREMLLNTLKTKSTKSDNISNENSAILTKNLRVEDIQGMNSSSKSTLEKSPLRSIQSVVKNLPESKQQEIIDKINRISSTLLKTNPNSVTIRLEPEELGAVRVKVSSRNDQIFITMSPEKSEVESLLKTRSSEILSSIGVATGNKGNVVFTVESPNSNYQFTQDQQQFSNTNSFSKQNTNSQNKDNGDFAGLGSSSSVKTFESEMNAIKATSNLGWLA